MTAAKNLLLILLMIPCGVLGQQLLWSTTKVGQLSDANSIPLENVAHKVMEYYDFYEYYYDLSGFSRDGFQEFLKKDLRAASSIKWDPALRFDTPTAFAFKGNSGRGSMVIVMLIQKENIDLVLFSNEVGIGAISARSYEGEKFAKWFYTFWNYGTDCQNKSVINTSKSVETELTLANRRFVQLPKFEADYGKGTVGRIAVEVRVNPEGKVVYARAGVKGTTLSDQALWRKCEEAVLGTN